MLKKLEVSKSGYYDYLKRGPSKTKQRREKIIKEVEKIYNESHEIYGSLKITQILNKNGEKVSQKNIYFNYEGKSLESKIYNHEVNFIPNTSLSVR